MIRTKSWQIWGTIAAIVLLLIVGAHYFLGLERSIAARVPKQVCIPSLSRTPTCYAYGETLSTDEINGLTVSPDGRTLANGYRQTIQLWNLETRTLQRSLKGHQDWITALAISPNNRILASSSLDRTVKLWDLETGQLLRTLESGRVTCLRFSPDGQILASGSRNSRWADGVVSEGGIQRWELTTGQPLPILGSEQVASLAFSPDGRTLASGHLYTQLWDLGTGQLLHSLDSGEVTSLLFSPDGQTLISASSKTKFWNVVSGKLLQAFKSSSSELALSPDGTILAASSGGTINLWQLETKKFLGNLRGSFYSSLFVAFGLDGQVLISGSSDGMKVWQQTFPKSAYRITSEEY